MRQGRLERRGRQAEKPERTSRGGCGCRRRVCSGGSPRVPFQSPLPALCPASRRGKPPGARQSVGVIGRVERRFRADSTATAFIISSAAAERHAARTAGNRVWSAPRGGPDRFHSRRRAQQAVLMEGTVRLNQRRGAQEVRPKHATVARAVCLHPLWPPSCDSRSTFAAVSSRWQAASCGSPRTCRSAQGDCGTRPAARSSSRVAAVWCGNPGTPDRAWLLASPASRRGGMCRTCLPRVPHAACAGM
jgi:hypothetical protein